MSSDLGCIRPSECGFDENIIISGCQLSCSMFTTPRDLCEIYAVDLFPRRAWDDAA